ncbi:MAG: alpha/beta hydrolase [Lachnospiraceae bacterium]|nr:alpha/beta hydrolase [Lachnospiraceae bacterium]
MMETVEIKRDGLTLRGFMTVPDTPEYDMVIQFHGFQSNCGREEDSLMFMMSQHLSSLGLGTIRVDFNGHGESDGKMQDMTVLNEVEDANAVLRYVKSLPQVRRIYLLGHSQGGVVASILAGYYPDVVDKLVLMAAAATLKDDALKGTIMGMTYDPHAIPDVMNVRGIDMGGFYFRTGQTLPIYEWASHYEGPVCIMHGDADVMVDCSAAKKFHAGYKNSELHLVPGGNHSFTDEARGIGMKIAGEFLLRD